MSLSSSIKYQSTFEFVGDLIQSLLRHHQTAEQWARDLHPEGKQPTANQIHFCPSLLLSGAAQNGKTHLIDETIHKMNHHSSEEENPLFVLPVVPPIAEALLHSETEASRRKNGYTMLKRVIKQEIKKQIELYAKGQLPEASGGASAAAALKAEKDVAIVVVLDHLELFIEMQKDVFAQGTNANDESHRRQGARTNLPYHTAFCTDLCLLLKSCSSGSISSFSLFDLQPNSYTISHRAQEELAVSASPPPTSSSDALFFQKHKYVKQIMFVGLFTNELSGSSGANKNQNEASAAVDEGDNNFVKKCFHFSFQLDTPNEAERIRFFKSQLQPYTGRQGKKEEEEKEEDEDNLLFFITELAKKVGGVTYGGLLELATIAQSLLSQYREDQQQHASTTTPDHHSDTKWALQHVAQQVMQIFLSKSVPPPSASTSRALPLASVAADYYKEQCGYIDVTDTRWDDIVGLASVKEAIQNFFLLPLQHAAIYHRFNTGKDGVLRPLVSPSTGMLLYGPPGTGKTMLAKAMATELHYAFLYMNIADLIVSEVGESEKRLDHLFYDLAVRRSPCIIFMDEMQAIFSRRYHTREEGKEGEKGGDGHRKVTGSAASSTHDARLVSHLSLLLQQSHALFFQQQQQQRIKSGDGEVESPAAANQLQIIFIGATNHKELIDPVLLSAGRLDTQLYVPPPEADAAAVFVQQHVRGKWAHWFAHYRAVLLETIKTETIGVTEEVVQQWVEVVQRTIISYFVEQMVSHTSSSAAKSGADIQNVITKFGLELAKQVIEEQNKEQKAAKCKHDDGSAVTEEMKLSAAMVRALFTLTDISTTGETKQTDDAAVLLHLSHMSGGAVTARGLSVSSLVQQILTSLCSV